MPIDWAFDYFQEYGILRQKKRLGEGNGLLVAG